MNLLTDIAMTALTLLTTGSAVGIAGAIPAIIGHLANPDADLFEYAESQPEPPDPAFIRRHELPDRVWQMEALVAGHRAPRDETEKKFLAYIEENPHVYGLFDRFTREAITRGHKRFSHWNVINRIRWEIEVETSDDGGEFKIGNDYIGLYARLWMERNRRHIDFFETKLRAVEADLVNAMGAIVEAAAS